MKREKLTKEVLDHTYGIISEYGGNISSAARKLQITPAAVFYRISKMPKEQQGQIPFMQPLPKTNGGPTPSIAELVRDYKLMPNGFNKVVSKTLVDNLEITVSIRALSKVELKGK